jgi:hypothetical protein
MAAEFGVGMNETGATMALGYGEDQLSSERRIGDLHVVMCSTLIAKLSVQARFVVSPDPITQIIEQLDNRHGLLGCLSCSCLAS